MPRNSRKSNERKLNQYKTLDQHEIFLDRSGEFCPVGVHFSHIQIVI